jgi:Xaa-Pro aminopeptidase
MVSDDLVIPWSEHKDRLEKVRRRLVKSRLGALYLANPTRILYATGFAHISTERPLAVVIPREGPVFMMGPHLEFDHVKQDCPLIEEVYTYQDYPGSLHPMRHFAKILATKGLASSRIATDSFQGAAGGWGYRGPSIAKLMKEAKFLDGRDIVDNMRLVKSQQELRLLRESAKWSQVAHDILLENVRPGSSDVLVGLRTSFEALSRMLRRLGRRYRQLKWGLSPVVVGFRGQVGPESAIPHAVFAKRKIRKGDVLVTEAGVEIGGYTSELERTVIVGKASSKSRRYFQVMLTAQSAALKAFKAGVSCSRVDDVARGAVETSGLSNCLRHHTGHGIGLDGHEPPWLDPGDRTVMRAGMVFSCEPGLYVPGYAGFRHSDTIVVTRSGMDFITEYPRELEEMTI